MLELENICFLIFGACRVPSPRAEAFFGHCAEVVPFNKVEGIKLVVNLISFNGIGHSSYIRPLRESVLEFQCVLIDNGVFSFIRNNMEDDESKSCG